jgi:uncharacterized membrane protein YkoI
MLERAAVLCLATCLAAASPAAAQQAAPTTSPETAPLWGYIGLATPVETVADVTPFAGLHTPIDQALADAQRSGGGRVVEIGFARKGAAGWYAALVARADGLRYLRIDPANGAVSNGDHADVTRAQLNAQGQRDLDALGASPIDLATAVADVERGGGHVISAGIEQLNGVPQYYVETVLNGKLQPYTVDPQSGRVAKPE